MGRNMNNHPFFASSAHGPLSPRSREKQALADQRQLRLSLNPATPGQPTLDEEWLSVYLETFNSDRHREVAELLVRKYCRKISFAELQNRLQEAVATFNQKIGDSPYNVLVERNHSSEWVAELALKHLNQLPMAAVDLEEHYVCHLNSLYHCNTHVIFDDCAYSGEQLSSNLRNLLKGIRAMGSNRPHRLIILVAFMTDFAKERVLKKFADLKEEFSPLDIQLDLIVGERLLSMKDLDIKDATIRELTDVLAGPRITNDAYFEQACLIWTDWKTPDYVSMPTYFRSAMVPREYDKHDGMLFEDFPEKFHSPKSFFPKIKTPYGDKTIFKSSLFSI